MSGRQILRGMGLAALVSLTGCLIASVRPPPMPEPSGRVLRSTWGDQGVVSVGDQYLLLNNQWNKRAGAGASRVFVEEIGGEQVVGWQWDFHGLGVAAYPEIIHGGRPWGDSTSGTPFPIRAGSRKVTVDFDVRMDAYGIYDLAFDLWFLSAPAVAQPAITHEVMIFNVASGMVPGGVKVARVEVAGKPFDLFVDDKHGDDTGQSPKKWVMVTFLPRERILRGPLALDAFVECLLERGIVTRDHYLAGVEFGNELVLSTGITEIKGFAVRVE